MNKRINYAFLAFLAWMAALLCMTTLSSCGSATYHTQHSYGPDSGLFETKPRPTCAAYN